MGGFYWIASYPKSGNTWMRLLLASLLDGGAPPDFTAKSGFAGAAAGLSDLEQFLEVEASDLTASEQTELRHDLALVIAGEIAEPQFRKVHDQWGQTPAGRPLFPPQVTLGSLYLVRDPRDVAVSWAYHSGLSLDQAIAFLGNPEAVVAIARKWQDQCEQHLGRWGDHVASWLAAEPTPLVIRYEDLVADPAAAVLKAACHCNLAAPAAAVAGAVAATRFDRLQQQEKIWGFALGQQPGQPFFRRGIVGGWRDTLTSVQAARIVKDHGAMMAQFGYL